MSQHIGVKLKGPGCTSESELVQRSKVSTWQAPGDQSLDGLYFTLDVNGLVCLEWVDYTAAGAIPEVRCARASRSFQGNYQVKQQQHPKTVCGGDLELLTMLITKSLKMYQPRYHYCTLDREPFLALRVDWLCAAYESPWSIIGAWSLDHHKAVLFAYTRLFTSHQIYHGSSDRWYPRGMLWYTDRSPGEPFP